MKKFLKILFVFIILLTCIVTIYYCKETKTKEYNTIAFLGDSITNLGWTNDYGYIRQIENKFREKGKEINIIPAGINGNTTPQMVERIENDVLNYNPDVVFVMGGINNIWWNTNTFDEFKRDINAIIDKTKERNTELIFLNITLLFEDINNEKNVTVDQYNTALEEICKKRNIQYIDLNTELKNELKLHNEEEGNIVTVDGVHLNELGNTIVANKIMNDFSITHKL